MGLLPYGLNNLSHFASPLKGLRHAIAEGAPCRHLRGQQTGLFVSRLRQLFEQISELQGVCRNANALKFDSLPRIKRHFYFPVGGGRAVCNSETRLFSRLRMKRNRYGLCRPAVFPETNYERNVFSAEGERISTMTRGSAVSRCPGSCGRQVTPWSAT